MNFIEKFFKIYIDKEEKRHYNRTNVFERALEFKIRRVICFMKEKTYEIFTDASFDNETKIAVYAIVILQNKKIIKAFAKKCRLNLENSTECEVFAVFQAINIIETNLIKNKKNQNFLIQTDCEIAKDFFNKERKIKIFKKNFELCNKIKETYKRVFNKMVINNCSIKLGWISRKQNKLAHKYSYSVFKKLRSMENKNHRVSLKRKKLLQFLQEFNSKQCKVLIYLCLISSEDKFVIKTQNDISKALELSSSNINRIFKEFKELKMIEKINNGKYQLLI